MKKVCLELGGKSPVIIFKDADLELAVQEAWQAGYANVSQNCVAGTYADAGSASCTVCAAGNDNANTASTDESACLNCAAGKYNANTASTDESACQNCGAGTYAEAGSASCTVCAAGKQTPINILPGRPAWPT